MTHRLSHSIATTLHRLRPSNISTGVGPLLSWALLALTLVTSPGALAVEQKVDFANKKITAIYSPEELKALFTSPEFQTLYSEIRTQLAAFPDSEKRKITDTEIAFTWGSDWFELGAHLRTNEKIEALMKISNEDFVISERYVPSYIKNRKKISLAPEWTALPWQKITALIGQIHSLRIMDINKAIPGFALWLLDGNSAVPWVLTDEPLNQKYCQNAQVFQIRQTTVACQSPEIVKIQRSWFQSALPKDIADVFVHELVRYRANLLAQETQVAQETQDAITAQITESILNPSVSPEDLYSQLERTNLLIESARIPELRIYEIVLTMKKKMSVLVEMIRFNMLCDQNPRIDKKVFELLQREALRQISNCHRYQTPEYDKAVCEIKTLAFHIWDHRARCANR